MAKQDSYNLSFPGHCKALVQNLTVCPTVLEPALPLPFKLEGQNGEQYVILCVFRF